MAKSNTATKTEIITNKPVQTVQSINVKPNGNTVIVEKNKSVVPTTTTKDKVRTDATGTPIADVAINRTVKDKTTAITRTVINQQGEVVKQTAAVNTSKNVVRVKVVTPYTSPDVGIETPVVSGPITNPTQYQQVISYPVVNDDGTVEPPLDTSGEDYVVVGSTESTNNGALLAQTYRSPRDGFVSKIRFYLADVGAAGDMILNFCATTRAGEPDLAQVFASKTIPYADLKRGWNDVTLIPPFVQKGKLYAVNFISTGNHTFLLTIGGNFSQGTFFVSQDQSWFKGNQDEDLAMQVFHCLFTNLQTITTMAPLTLESGIGAMHATLFEIEPEGTKRILRGRLNGVWTDLAADNIDFPFDNLPPLVELQQVLSGTKDLMPATRHDVSKVTTYRLRTDFKGISKLITTGSPVTTATVTILLHGYKEADHNCAIKILKADNTVINHSVVSDTPTDDPDVIERKATFSFTSMSSARIRIDGDTNSSLSTFGVSEILYQFA